MAFYRKKPVVIEARRLTHDGTALEILHWIKENGGDAHMHTFNDQLTMHIRTLEGVMTAIEGDYIIKGVEGEFYPCKPNIFEATYEEVSE